jgi:ppGpp synthetase/RelA/SpoT-type nucleotidyltranferase
LELASVGRSNKEINAAGEFLRVSTALLNQKTPETLLVVSNWRSSHELAMRKVMAALRRHAKLSKSDAVISGRAKRIRSIAAKLIREPNMALSTMQDIAGCRAVMDSVENAELFAQSIRSELAQKLSPGSQIGEKNYIENPKADGYRSIHFVVRYKASSSIEAKGRKIEIQIRSLLQHRWATALETVDLFTGQTLKNGGGNVRWRRFFALSSNIFAHQENRPLIPGMPVSYGDLSTEMQDLAGELRVVERLQGWSKVMRDVLEGSKPRDLRGVFCYLVELDVDESTTHIRPYRPEELKVAHENYLASELENGNVPNRSAVLVKAYSLDEVREAFPGYYGDTKAFLRALHLAGRHADISLPK